MPNRIIKDSIRTSKSVNTMTDFQFRLWTYLLTYVDDYGRGSADPELLKGFVFPRRKGVTETTIEKSLQELANIGSILLYDVDGESYFCFPNWADHQRIQTKKSRFPSPDDGTLKKVTVSHGEPPSESNPIQSESNPNPNPNPKPKITRARILRSSGLLILVRQETNKKRLRHSKKQGFLWKSFWLPLRIRSNPPSGARITDSLYLILLPG